MRMITLSAFVVLGCALAVSGGFAELKPHLKKNDQQRDDDTLHKIITTIADTILNSAVGPKGRSVVEKRHTPTDTLGKIFHTIDNIFFETSIGNPGRRRRDALVSRNTARLFHDLDCKRDVAELMNDMSSPMAILKMLLGARRARDVPEWIHGLIHYRIPSGTAAQLRGATRRDIATPIDIIKALIGREVGETSQNKLINKWELRSVLSDVVGAVLPIVTDKIMEAVNGRDTRIIDPCLSGIMDTRELHERVVVTSAILTALAAAGIKEAVPVIADQVRKLMKSGDSERDDESARAVVSVPVILTTLAVAAAKEAVPAIVNKVKEMMKGDENARSITDWLDKAQGFWDANKDAILGKVDDLVGDHLPEAIGKIVEHLKEEGIDAENIANKVKLFLTISGVDISAKRQGIVDWLNNHGMTNAADIIKDLK